MNRNSSMAGLASLVQSRGRNGDSMLVHMTPGEVRGLQSLALAHGGQLSINPDTGLYEANFLKKLLPTIIGAVLTPLTGGLINPLTAGFLVGGVEAARTGDLGKGLMAGLGAYGGAGLSTALAGTGAAAAAGAGTNIAAEGAKVAAETAGTEAAKEAARQAAMKEAAQAQIQKQIATKGMFGRLPEGVASFKNIGAGAGEIFKTGGAGLGGIGGMGAAGSAFNTLGMPAKAGLTMTAANALSPEMEMPEGGAYNIDDSYYESMGYSPEQGRFLGGQWRKGYPGFPPPGMAEGGVIPAPNGNYPLARPSDSIGGYEADIDPYTGEERFADGGSVGNNQSLEAYYQSLLAPPVQQGGGGQDFANYMQGLNKFVTSPVAAPTPPAQQPPPAGVAPPGAGGRPIAGGGAGYYGDGGMRWDATQGRFVADAPQGRPGGNDPFSAIGNIDLSNFGNIDFSALREYMGGMGGARGGNTVGPKAPFDRGVDDQFIDYMGDDMGIGAGAGATGGGMGAGAGGAPDLSGIDLSALQGMIGGGMGQGPAVNPFAEGYTPPVDTGMGDVAYAGGTPGFDMTGGMGGGMDEIAYAGGTPGFDMTGGGREYTPPPDFSSGPIMPMQPQMPELAQQPAPQQPAPDMSGFDFSSLAGLGSLGGMGGMSPQMPQAPQMPELAPQPAPQQPAFDMSSLGGGMDFGGMGGMQQPAPQPAPDMGGFGGFGGGMDFSGLGGFDVGAMAPQPAPSYDMSAFGGFGGMPQQPAPSFDMGGMGGGMDFGGIDYSGMDFGSVGGFAGGGPIQYAAGGKFLRGPGDGMSDDIKANINGEQEARLADGEFVIPADVVSHIGNGSSEAGADRLYKMMADIRKARTGKTRQAPEINAKKYLPS